MIQEELKAIMKEERKRMNILYTIIGILSTIYFFFVLSFICNWLNQLNLQISEPESGITEVNINTSTINGQLKTYKVFIIEHSFK